MAAEGSACAFCANKEANTGWNQDDKVMLFDINLLCLAAIVCNVSGVRDCVPLLKGYEYPAYCVVVQSAG